MSAAMAVPLQLPDLTGSRAWHLNRIAAWRGPLRIPGHEMFTLARVEPFEAAADLGTDRVRIDMKFGGDEIVTTVSTRFVLDLFGALDANLDLDPLPPPDIAALMLEAVLLPLLEGLQRSTGRPVAIQGVTVASNADVRALGLSLPLNHEAAEAAALGSSMVYLALLGPEFRQTLTLSGSADALGALLNPWPVGLRPFASLPFLASLQVGATLLSRSLIASLRVGDALLLQDVFMPAPFILPSVLRMDVERAIITTIRNTENGWRIESAPQQKRQAGQTMADENKNNLDEEVLAPSDLDQLPVRIVFEAARVDLPLGELRQLGSGSLLQINSSPGTVRILANGQLIGNGELITIDGRAGVRITAFSAIVDNWPSRTIGK
jgi:type III secretion protein Q